MLLLEAWAIIAQWSSTRTTEKNASVEASEACVGVKQGQGETTMAAVLGVSLHSQL